MCDEVSKGTLDSYGIDGWRIGTMICVIFLYVDLELFRTSQAIKLTEREEGEGRGGIKRWGRRLDFP